MMATAAKITIAEVEHLVEPGQIDPDHVITPGIYVNGSCRASVRKAHRATNGSAGKVTDDQKSACDRAESGAGIARWHIT